MQVLVMSDVDILASEDLFFIKAAADFIKRNRRTLRRWYQSGRLEAAFITPRGKWVYRRAQLEPFISRSSRVRPGVNS